ncbi:hypothetical protein ABK040_000337 [Willaertia magna]
MARKEKKVQEVEFVDPHEPVIWFAFFKMLYIIGWETIWILIGLIGFACFGAMPHIFNVLMGQLIIVITSPTNNKEDYKQEIHDLSVYMAIIAALAGVLTWMGGSFMNWAFERIGIRFKTTYIRSLLRQEIGYFDMKKTGQLMAWMTEREKGGELKEKGKHDELLNIPNGFYAALAKKQLLQNSQSADTIRDEEEDVDVEEGDIEMIEK